MEDQDREEHKDDQEEECSPAGPWPTASSVILATVATFFYFFSVAEITPRLYSLWR
jgi:hypothetical protein